MRPGGNGADQDKREAISRSCTAVGLLTLLTLGYRMWWQRRPTRTASWTSFGKPPTRGTWRDLPRPLLGSLVLAAIAIGWALPLLGISLLAFLALDAALARTRRRETSPTP